MQCPGCAAENMDGSSSCWECGQSFVEEKERTRGGWVLWAVLALVTVTFAVMLLSAGSGLSGGGGGGDTTSSVSPTSSVESSATTSTK